MPNNRFNRQIYYDFLAAFFRNPLLRLKLCELCLIRNIEILVKYEISSQKWQQVLAKCEQIKNDKNRNMGACSCQAIYLRRRFCLFVINILPVSRLYIAKEIR